MTRHELTDSQIAVLVGRTEAIFSQIDAGSCDDVREQMADAVAAVLTRGLVLDTWAQTVAETGNLVACRDTAVEAAGASGEGAEGEPVLGRVVGRTTLECRAGQWHGRAALDGDGRVVGLLVVSPGHGPLPF